MEISVVFTKQLVLNLIALPQAEAKRS